MKTLPTYEIRIHMSGPIEAAKQVIRAHVMAHPQCVTITPTTFIYTGGEEAGYTVGLLDYPRFPESRESLNRYAESLAEALLDGTHQWSALIVNPDETKWISRRPEK